MEYFDDINAHKYIYLSEIEEGLDNTLRVVVKEAGLEAESESVAVGDTTFAAQAIVSDERCRTYEIAFHSYIGYSVIDESYAIPNDDEVFEGRLFCVYEESIYLNYISKVSVACEDYPGPFKHYGLNCLNHVIDIASTEEPVVRVLK